MSSFDIAQVAVQDGCGERLFAGEIRVERPLWHAGRVGDVFDAAGGEPSCMDQVEAGREQPLADFGIGRSWHGINSRRLVIYVRAACGTRVQRLWFPPARLAAYIAVSATLTRSSMRSRSAGSKLGPSGTLTMPILAVMGERGAGPALRNRLAMSWRA